MAPNLAEQRLMERTIHPGKRMDQYHSAEFVFEGLGVSYQFKIWDGSSVLVKENSDFLARLKVGDTLSVRFYWGETGRSSECLTTTIRCITRNEQGRLKGHYLVGLEILETEP